MPAIDISLLPEGSDFIVRLEPVGGWPDAQDGFFAPEKLHIEQALESRFGSTFDVLQVESAQQYTTYHIAKQDRPLSGYHVARAIAAGLGAVLRGRSSEMPDIDVKILLPSQLNEPIGYSHADNARRQQRRRV